MDTHTPGNCVECIVSRHVNDCILGPDSTKNDSAFEANITASDISKIHHSPDLKYALYYY